MIIRIMKEADTMDENKKIEIKYEKPKEQKKPKKLTANDIMKIEIAEELGLMDKVKETGWKSLTARESGRIGGIMAKKQKEMTKAYDSDSDNAETSE